VIAPLKWLIVVQPGQRDLYDVLRASLKEESPVAVIYERRIRERRRGSDSPRGDRRRSDRRQRRPSGWLYECEVLRVAEPAATADARPSAPPPAIRPSQSCPTCGIELEFEVPRFPQPPARLQIEAIHVGDRGTGAQHYVEIHAFTATGRPLLSQRNQAWRRPANRP
jgi:hypothetical protein